MQADSSTLAQAGYHFVFLDWDDALSVAEMRENINWVSSASGGKCVAIVRVPSAESCWIQSALDSGVGGIIVPGIKSTWDAEQVITSARRNARNPAIFVQLDCAASAGVAHSLLALPGIDGAFAALDALFLDLKGLPKSQIETEFNACERAFLAAGEANGKPVMWYARNAEHVAKRLRQGYRLIVTGSCDGQLAGSGQALLESAAVVKRWRNQGGCNQGGSSEHRTLPRSNLPRYTRESGGESEGSSASSPPSSLHRPKEKVHKYHIHRHIHRGPRGERSESVEISQGATFERPCTRAECSTIANQERDARSINQPRAQQPQNAGEAEEMFSNRTIDNRGDTLTYGAIVAESENPDGDMLHRDEGASIEQHDQDHPAQVHFAAMEEGRSPSGGRFNEEVEYDRTAQGGFLAAKSQETDVNGQETQEFLAAGADARGKKFPMESRAAQSSSAGSQQQRHSVQAPPPPLDTRVPSFGCPVQLQPVHHQLTPLPAKEGDEWIPTEPAERRKPQERIVVAEEQWVDGTGDHVVRIARIEDVTPSPQYERPSNSEHPRGSNQEAKGMHHHTKVINGRTEAELAAIREREATRLAEDHKEGGVTGWEHQMRDRWVAHQAKDDVKYHPRDYGGFHRAENDLEEERNLPTTETQQQSERDDMGLGFAHRSNQTDSHKHHHMGTRDETETTYDARRDSRELDRYRRHSKADRSHELGRERDDPTLDNAHSHTTSGKTSKTPRRDSRSDKSGSKLFGLFSRNKDKEKDKDKSPKQKRRSRDSVDEDMADSERRESEHDHDADVDRYRTGKYENSVPVRPTDIQETGAPTAGRDHTTFVSERVDTEYAYPAQVVPEQPRRYGRYENSIPLRAEPIMSNVNSGDDAARRHENIPNDQAPVRPPTPKAGDVRAHKGTQRNSITEHIVEEEETVQEPIPQCESGDERQHAERQRPPARTEVFLKGRDSQGDTFAEHIVEQTPRGPSKATTTQEEVTLRSMPNNERRAPTKTEIVIASRDSDGDEILEQLVQEEVRRGPTSFPNRIRQSPVRTKVPEKDKTRGNKSKSQSTPEPESMHMPGEWVDGSIGQRKSHTAPVAEPATKPMTKKTVVADSTDRGGQWTRRELVALVESPGHERHSGHDGRMDHATTRPAPVEAGASPHSGQVAVVSCQCATCVEVRAREDAGTETGAGRSRDQHANNGDRAGLASSSDRRSEGQNLSRSSGGAQKVTVRKVSNGGPWPRRTPGDDERVGWPHENADNRNDQPRYEVTTQPLDASAHGTMSYMDSHMVTAPDARSAAATVVSHERTERRSRDFGRPVDIDDIMRLPGTDLTASPRHRIEHARGDIVERHDRVEAREGRGAGLSFGSFLGRNKSKGKNSRGRSGSGSSSMASPRSSEPPPPSPEVLRPKPLEPGDTIDDVQTFIIDEDTVHIPGQPPKTIIRKYIVEEEVGRPAKAFAVTTDSEFVAANRAATELARSASYLPAKAPPYPTVANPGPSGDLNPAQIQRQFSAALARRHPARPDLVQQCSTEHIQNSRKFFSTTHSSAGGVY